MAVVIETIEIDRASVDRFRAELAAALATQRPVSVCIDLRNVTFLDASGVRALLDAERAARATNACLEIEAEGTVRRVLELTGVWERLGAAEVAACR
jgi:anti-sigma B factor antagonist